MCVWRGVRGLPEHTAVFFFFHMHAGALFRMRRDRSGCNMWHEGQESESVFDTFKTEEASILWGDGGGGEREGGRGEQDVRGRYGGR